MTDVMTEKQRSHNMSMIKGTNTTPEIVVRMALRAKGVRKYRVAYPLRGKPDLVFVREKLAVFVDGCFWHKCPECYREPRTNTAFWKNKIDNNAKRDTKNNGVLRMNGWVVIRIWEHEIRSDPSLVADRIISELTRLRISLRVKYPHMRLL